MEGASLPLEEWMSYVRATAAVDILHRMAKCLPADKAAADVVRDYIDEQMKGLRPSDRGRVRAAFLSPYLDDPSHSMSIHRLELAVGLTRGPSDG